jgi:hypothetical protein
VLLLRDWSAEDVDHTAASFIEIKACTKDRVLAGPGLYPCNCLIEKLLIAGVFGIMQITRSHDPRRRYANEELHANRGSLPL